MIYYVHDRADDDLLPNLRYEDRRWGVVRSSVLKNEDGRGFFDLRGRITNIEGGFFDLRVRRTKIGGSSIFWFRRSKKGGSSFFEAERSKTSTLRRTPSIFEEPLLSSKNPAFFEEPSIFEELLHLRLTPYLRYSEPKSEELPIFDLRNRRSKNPHLQSSIFGPKDRRTLSHHLQF